MPQIHVLTVSDRVHGGRAPDTAGPRALELLTELLPDWTTHAATVPDGVEAVRAAVVAARSAGADAVLTLGGTGVAPRDLTPEAMAGLLDRELPGVAELLRREGAGQTPAAALSRGRAGIIDRPVGGSTDSMEDDTWGVSGVEHQREAAGGEGGGADDRGAADRGADGGTRSTVVVNLPGSLGAAEQGVSLLAPLLGHLVDQLAGGDHVRH